MKTENKDSEKDLNANPESRLNTNKSAAKPGNSSERTPSKKEREKRKNAGDKNLDSELLADEGSGTVSERSTSSAPSDIAGVADLDNGMRRAKKG